MGEFGDRKEQGCQVAQEDFGIFFWSGRGCHQINEVKLLQMMLKCIFVLSSQLKTPCPSEMLTSVPLILLTIVVNI